MVNDQQFQEFLVTKRAVNKTESTHTSMGGITNQGSYSISDDELENFYDLYYQEVFVKGKHLSFTEANRELTPVKVDLDFKYKSANEERRYHHSHIKKIIGLYSEIVSEYYDLNLNDEDGNSPKLCFVMEKEKPTKLKGKDNLIKDGIHLMFPFLITKPEAQHIFREYVYKKLDPILDELKLENPYSDVHDVAVIQRNNWMMYGSKKPHGEPYKLTKIYQMETDPDNISEIENNYSNEALVRILSIRSHFIETPVTVAKLKEFQQKADNMKLKKNRLSNRKNKKVLSNITLDEEKLEEIKMYMECLSVERASERNSWIQVGWCLYNIGQGAESLLKLWIEFSKTAPEYELEAEENCVSEWSEMETNEEGLTEYSLIYWASKDNPEKTDLIKREITMTKIANSLKPIDNTGESIVDIAFAKDVNIAPEDVAGVLHKMYNKEYKLVGVRGKNGVYYHYDNHRWQQIDGHMLIREKIRTNIYEAYKKYIIGTIKESKTSNDEEVLTQARELLQDTKKLCKVINQLRNTSFKNNVMEEAKELFNDRTGEFLTRLDSKTHLMGFNNGVYDMRDNVFRKGHPDDWISMTTGIDYIDDYDWKDEEVIQVLDFINQILPDEEVREYVLTLLASFMVGGNNDEKFHIWTGSGGNGKSKLIELFELCMGDYACKLSISLLTTKRKGSNEAQPEVARTKGKRLAVLQEPDEQTRINVGLMKEMTGGDKLIARNLYEAPIEFKPQFSMILVCNHLPELPYDDEGTWRRVRAVEFKSKFVDAADWDKNDPYQFPKDVNLAKNFQNWKEPFMWILMQYLRIYQSEGIKEPKAVTSCTDSYRQQNDHFNEFYINHIHRGDEDDFMGINELNNVYVNLCFHNGEKPKRRKELQKYIDKKIGKVGERDGKKGWKGYILTEIETDQNDDLDMNSIGSVTSN